MTAPNLVRLGDVIRERGDCDVYTITGHHTWPGGTRPCAWQARFVPVRAELGEPFEAAQAYDFAERDIVPPGRLVGFADSWSVWAEGAADAARGEHV